MPIVPPTGQDIPETVTELLQAMVRIDTVNTAVSGRPRAEAELVEYLSKIASVWMLEIELLPVVGQADQLLLTCRVGEDRPWVLFDSHLDTVAVEGMTIDPFGGEIVEGDRLRGRGACDTKGTGAAMLWALRNYSGGEGDRPNNIALLFSVDEEIAMTGVQSFIQNDLPSQGWSPSLVIVGEPTEHTPVIAHNGVVRWTLTTRGRAGHSSLPSESHSAIRDMVAALSLLQREYIDRLDAEHDLTGPAVSSVNLIRGGSAPNIIPDLCVCEIDRRVVPGEDHTTILPTVAALLDSLKADHPELHYEQELKVAHPPLLPDRSAGVIDVVRQALLDHDIRRPCVGAPFGTHAGYFGDAGLPALVLGPGSPHPAHTKDEWVSVKQIELGTKVYESLMRSEFKPINHEGDR
ncbi:MAG: M20/M25/M40 family metallo-hydrolase [Planctomycetota bacterium]